MYSNSMAQKFGPSLGQRLLFIGSLIFVSQAFFSVVLQVAHAAGTVGTGTAASCTEVALDSALSGGGLVDFDCGGTDHTIVISSTKSIAENTTIEGNGQITISGDERVQVFTVESGVTLIIERMTIAEGYTASYPGGGAVRSNGELHVRYSQFTDNRSDVFGGAVNVSGNGSATINATTFRGNESGWGGAISVGDAEVYVEDSEFIQNAARAEGGAINIFDGALNVDHSSFYENTCIGCAGGAIRIRNDAGSASIANSTFARNVAGTGGAIFTVGTLEITNSTLSGNEALDHEAGGLWVGRGMTTLTDSTLSENIANEKGGGIYVTAAGYIDLANNIVANNIAPAQSDCGSEGVFLPTGVNLSSDSSCPGFTLSNTDPMLDLLGDYGGPTETHRLRLGSPAIDAGDNVNCPPTDQRGVPRPLDGDEDGIPICDIGSFEVEVGPQSVAIDIRPLSRRNVINPRSRGTIWVALLSDTESPFDPSLDVDIPTVEFGPAGATVTRYKAKDINRDGLDDLLLRFNIGETGIACGDSDATLTGETFDSLEIVGTDDIRTIGCRWWCKARQQSCR